MKKLKTTFFRVYEYSPCVSLKDLLHSLTPIEIDVLEISDGVFQIDKQIEINSLNEAPKKIFEYQEDLNRRTGQDWTVEDEFEVEGHIDTYLLSDFGY